MTNTIRTENSTIPRRSPVGTGNQSAIVILVERTTRYVMLGHLPGGDHTAEIVRDVLVNLIGTLPAHLRGSLTWDQGAEMAAHKAFRIVTGVPVYFCDPASPWQRGSNENTHGLVRQYFPKGTDLTVYGPEDLEHVAQKLNGRPRKTLGQAITCPVSLSAINRRQEPIQIPSTSTAS